MSQMRTDWTHETLACAIEGKSVEELQEQPLAERIGLAVAAYRAMGDILSIPEGTDFKDIGRTIHALPLDVKEKCAQTLGWQKKMHEALQPPQFFRDQIMQVHRGVLKDILNNPDIRDVLERAIEIESKVEANAWDMTEEVPFDDHNPQIGMQRITKKEYCDALDKEVPFEKRMTVMQFIADRQAHYWKKIDPILFAEFKPMLFRGIRWDEARPDIRFRENHTIWHGSMSEKELLDYGLSHPQSAYTSSCIITDRRGNVPGNASFAAALAAHEPLHSIQGYLKQKVREGVIGIDSPYYDVVKIFSFREDYNLSGYPPNMFGDHREPLFQAAMAAYLSAPWEATALQQGEAMGLAIQFYIGQKFRDPDAVDKTEELNDQTPALQKGIPDFNYASPNIVLPEDADDFLVWVEKWENVYAAFEETKADPGGFKVPSKEKTGLKKSPK